MTFGELKAIVKENPFLWKSIYDNEFLSIIINNKCYNLDSSFSGEYTRIDRDMADTVPLDSIKELVDWMEEEPMRQQFKPGDLVRYVPDKNLSVHGPYLIPNCVYEVELAGLGHIVIKNLNRYAFDDRDFELYQPAGISLSVPILYKQCTCPTLLSGHHDGCNYGK